MYYYIVYLTELMLLYYIHNIYYIFVIIFVYKEKCAKMECVVIERTVNEKSSPGF